MVELVVTAQTWGCRPSDLIGKGLSEFARYCLDAAGAMYLANLKEGKMPLGLEGSETDASTWL